MFQDINIIHELTGTKRFTDKDLPAILQCMRTQQQFPMGLWKKLQKRFVHTTKRDERLYDPAFLDGTELGIYWDTIARCIGHRARRDAQRANTAVHFSQARDDVIPSLHHLPHEQQHHLYEKFLMRTNIHFTGKYHGVLPFHLGMKVRITQKLSPSHGLVQESEGVIVHIVHDVEEEVFLQEPVAAAACVGENATVCEKVPLGVWLRMDEMENHPLLKEYKESTKRYIETNNIALDMLESEKDLANLIFLERTTSYPFKLIVEGTSYTITRTQLPFTHAMVRTAQASQGTM